MQRRSILRLTAYQKKGTATISHGGFTYCEVKELLREVATRFKSKIQALRLSEASVGQDRPAETREVSHIQEPTMSKIQEPTMSTTKRFTNATGSPVADNTNIMTAGRRGPALLQDIWLI